MPGLLVNILIASAVCFVGLFILSEILLYIKRKRINSVLEDSIRQEITSIKREHEENKVYLGKIEKLITRISSLIYNHEMHRTMEYFVLIEQEYKNLSEAYRKKVNLRLFEICCGLFDELCKFEMFLSASRVYRFMLEEIYNKGSNREREMMFTDIDARFRQINRFLSKKGLQLPHGRSP
jgi:hypothetical protein